MYERAPLYPKQKEVFLCPKRFTYCEAATKSGKTHLAIAWLFEQALLYGKNGYNYWWIAPTYQQAGIAFNRLALSLKEGALPSKHYTILEGSHIIKLANGTSISFKTGEKPNNLYGDDIYAVVIDEASRLKEASFHTVISLITSTEASVKMIGNVVDKFNWFYKACRKVENNSDKFSAYFRLTADDAIEGGTITRQMVDIAKSKLPHHVFRSLYYCEGSDSGMNPFGIDYIDACTIQIDSVDKQTFSYHTDKKVICYGIDLARGKTENADFTSIIGLTEKLEVTFDIFKGPWKQQLYRILNIIGNTPTFIELNSIGSTMFEMLIDDCEQLEGFNTTNKSKKELIETDLIPFILGRRLKIPSGIITDELKDFECVLLNNGNHTYNSTGHDDTVISLGLACKKYKEIMGESNVGDYEVCVFDIKHPEYNTINNNRNDGWKRVNAPITGF